MKKAKQLSSNVLTARSPQGSRFPVVSQRLRQTLACSPILRPVQCKASVEKVDFLAQILTCSCCVPTLSQTLS